jgi:hypothetical protein
MYIVVLSPLFFGPVALLILVLCFVCYDCVLADWILRNPPRCWALSLAAQTTQSPHRPHHNGHNVVAI